nr:FLAG-pVII fusion protein [VCSM13 FLAG-pVII modified interference-resistant helper phage]
MDYKDDDDKMEQVADFDTIYQAMIQISVVLCFALGIIAGGQR